MGLRCDESLILIKSRSDILTFYFTSYIDPTQITVKVINGLYARVTTVELDNLAAEIAATIPQ